MRINKLSEFEIHADDSSQYLISTFNIINRLLISYLEKSSFEQPSKMTQILEPNKPANDLFWISFKNKAMANVWCMVLLGLIFTLSKKNLHSRIQ